MKSMGFSVKIQEFSVLISVRFLFRLHFSLQLKNHFGHKFFALRSISVGTFYSYDNITST